MFSSTRREFGAISVGLLTVGAGCSESGSSVHTETSKTPTESGTSTNVDTTVPTEDYTLPDLWIANTTDRAVTVTVTWVLKGKTEPTLDLTIQVPSETAIKWHDNPLFNHEGTVTATTEGETGETLRDEMDWTGDNPGDNRGIEIVVKEGEIRVEGRVA